MVTIKFSYINTKVKLTRQYKTVDREDRAKAHAFVKDLQARARKSTVALVSIDVIDDGELIAAWNSKKQWVKGTK